MKVRAKENHRSFTIGKIYEATQDGQGYIRIVDDSGNGRTYPADWFEAVESREEPQTAIEYLQQFKAIDIAVKNTYLKIAEMRHEP